MLKLKRWYLEFIEKRDRNIYEKALYGFFYLISLFYGRIIYLRNFFYDKGFISVYQSKAKVISVGNISWAGSGKTTLAAFLYKKLSSTHSTAILRRGYGRDEGELLKEVTDSVFSSPSRSDLAKKLGNKFDLFILDDAFQHRKLARDINIVVMAAREFKAGFRLIPASFFREPINSLSRADIVVLNYSDEAGNISSIKKSLQSRFPGLKVYLSNYQVSGYNGLSGESYPAAFLMGKRVAALTAIGYPKGFFNKLKSAGVSVKREITYPDHYELGESEFRKLESELLSSGIKTLVITGKDKYHIPESVSGLDIFIMNVDLVIEAEEDFLKQVDSVISGGKDV
ncbi:MAG: tetraacyldisaccharide 4'-kinase [Candidatus Omnitrophica bacterium]|nr:tetraacyldisaccharide 4'-kinase [Candidatus Omnitrophota bacterium]MDD5429118.1 tetraacyldisaccharide 4'-kinase [Candidatus Omnitrophota bacterium]